MGEEVAYRTEPVWNCLDSCRENLADTAEMGDIDESATCISLVLARTRLPFQNRIEGPQTGLGEISS